MFIIKIVLIFFLLKNNKTTAQLIDKIIEIGEENCRFTKISKYSNGDMIVSTYADQGFSFSSHFYGLKENGRPLFFKDGKETPFNYINFETQSFFYYMYDDGEAGIIKTSTTKEEYLINFGRLFSNTQLYDFEKENIIYKQTRYLFNLNIIYNIRGSLFSLKDTNKYLYAGIVISYNINWGYSFPSTYNKYLTLYSLCFNKKDSISTETIILSSSTQLEAYGNMVSCFQTGLKNIFCFYIFSIYYKKYKIINYNEKLEKKIEEAVFTTKIIDENIFFKCIYYEKEIGIYLYYNLIDDKGPYPIISFKEIRSGKIESVDGLDEIKLDSYIFNSSLYSNDFIELTKNYYCLASVSKNKNILYIVILNIFDLKQVKIRYYLMKTFIYNNYKFYLDIRLNMFKESLSLASSYCKQEQCGDSDTYYSSLMIFSYPNSTDVNKDIIEEIFDKNKILEDLIFYFNFTNYISIENNIFGLVYYKINIYSIENCGKINLMSSSSNNEITVDYNLSNTEDLYVTFNSYDLFDCKIGYIYKVTEPDFEEFEKYPANKTTEYGDDKNIFNDNKKIYSGRLSYFNLYLKEKLTKECLGDCVLCYDNILKECLVVNCEFTLEIDENQKKYKKCLVKTDAPTEPPTEPPTESPTEPPTESPTEPQTQPPTEESIQSPTESTTQVSIKTQTEFQTEAPSEKYETTEKQKNEETYNTNIFSDKPLNAIDCIKEENLDCSHVIVKGDEIQELQEQIKNKVLNTTTYQKDKIVYEMENVVIQVSKYDDQDDEDQSNIDLGKCEQILRVKYTVPDDESLIIFKSDIKNNNIHSTYVQYEIYHPETLELLDLSVCSEEQISICVSVDLNEETKTLSNSLGESGHNIFDKNDSFYNDICVTYTTENGTDMSMTDRQHILEDIGNSNFCQVGCTFESFNYTTQKAKCNCDLKNTKKITNLNDIEFNMDLIITIFGGLKYSNYLVMNCYKLLLDFKLIQKNIGFIFMGIIFISLLILFFIYIIQGRKKIEYYIQAILKNKSVYINNRRSLKNRKKAMNSKLKNKGKKNGISAINKNKMNILNNNKNSIKKNVNRQSKKIIKKNNPPKKLEDMKSSIKSLKNPPESSSSLKNNLSKSNDEINKNGIKNLNINIIPIHNINYSKTKKGQNLDKYSNNRNSLIKANEIRKSLIKNNNNKKGSKGDINIYNKYKFKGKNKKVLGKKYSLKKDKKEKKVLDLDYINYQTLNIQELNNLQYNEAILFDKRTFLQYYCGLIRKKQLIIFTFVPIDDYNLVSIKISLFLLSFSLYMTVNAFFFNDNTMHQIYTNNGELDLLQHIPQIIYSSLISTVINTLLKQLSLSENNILSIKREKNLKMSERRAKETKNYLSIKLILFFIVNLILTIFFWYFISCFCAVYTNTQIILIKDSLISFGVSMLYPFGINIIPGIFRIPSLRAKKKDKLFLYKLSQLLSLI